MMNMQSSKALLLAGFFGVATLTACQPQSTVPQSVNQSAKSDAAKAESLFKLTAGIQDIMALEVDPAADAIWESVSTTVNKEGIHEHKPLKDEDWKKARGHALILIEASNLLVMDGRRVAREGVKTFEDHGTPGNLSPEESQAAIDANRATFVSYAHALRDVGEEILKAVEAKNAEGIMEAGATMDQVCEGCHLKFWYPGQKIPRFPNEAPEVDLK